MADAVWLLDLGNSALKVSLAQGRGRTPTRRFTLADLSLWSRDCEGTPAGSAWLCSSNRSAEAAVCAPLVRAGIAVVRVGEDIGVPLSIDYEPPNSLGIDRRVAAWEAWRTHGRGLAVVGAGTALTWDWVDDQGRFRGGAIAPGLSLIERGLRLAAPHLPRPDVGSDSPAFPPRSTQDAVNLGQDSAERGLVLELLRRFDEASGGGLPLIITGGDAPRVWRHLPKERSECKADLILEGVWALAQCGLPGDPAS